MSQRALPDMEAAFMQCASEGERLFKSGDKIAAISAFLSALRIGSRNANALSVVNSQLGSCYFQQGDYQLAAKHHEADVALARSMKNAASAASAYANLGNTYKAMNKFEAAIICFNNQLTLARTMKNWQSESRSLTNIGNGYLALGLSLVEGDETRANVNFQEALKNYLLVLDIAESHEDVDLTSKVYGNLGNVYDQLSSFDQAILCHKRRVQLANEANDLPAEGRAWCNLGNTHRAQGNVNEAIDCYSRDLKICITLADRAGEGVTCCNLALAHQAKGDFPRTKAYYERYIVITTELDDKHGLVSGYASLGRVFEVVGRYDDAMKCYQTQLSVAEELKDEGEVRDAVANINKIRQLQIEGHTLSHEEAISALVAALEAAEARTPKAKKTVKGTISRVLGKFKSKNRAAILQQTEAPGPLKSASPPAPSTVQFAILDKSQLGEAQPTRRSATLSPSSTEDSRPNSPDENSVFKRKDSDPSIMLDIDMPVQLRQKKGNKTPDRNSKSPETTLDGARKRSDSKSPEMELSPVVSPGVQLRKKTGFKAGMNRLSSLFTRKSSSENPKVYLPEVEAGQLAVLQQQSSRDSIFPTDFDVFNLPPEPTPAVAPVATVRKPTNGLSRPLPPPEPSEEQKRIARRGEELLSAINQIGTVPVAPVKVSMPKPHSQSPMSTNPLFDVRSEASSSTSTSESIPAQGRMGPKREQANSNENTAC